MAELRRGYPSRPDRLTVLPSCLTPVFNSRRRGQSCEIGVERSLPPRYPHSHGIGPA